LDGFIKGVKDLDVLNDKNLTISADSVKRGLVKYWDRDFVRSKINNCRDSRDRMFLTFLWMSGVRVSEAVGLRKCDIDFDNFVMRVRWLKSRKYKERVVPVHPHLLSLLSVFVGNLRSEDLVFGFSRQRAFQIVKKRMSDGSPHKFRHSFAVNWLRSGGRLEVLFRILGHSKIQTTMEYLKIVPTDQGKELIKIEF